MSFSIYKNIYTLDLQKSENWHKEDVPSSLTFLYLDNKIVTSEETLRC